MSTDEEDEEVDDLRLEMLKAHNRELFLKAKGWFQDLPGLWTAPADLRERRERELLKSITRYMCIDLNHAFNTQNHEDRRQAEKKDPRAVKKLEAKMVGGFLIGCGCVIESHFTGRVLRACSRHEGDTHRGRRRPRVAQPTLRNRFCTSCRLVIKAGDKYYEVRKVGIWHADCEVPSAVDAQERLAE